MSDSTGNVSEVKISLKANAERKDHFLMTLTKNNVTKKILSTKKDSMILRFVVNKYDGHIEQFYFVDYHLFII